MADPRDRLRKIYPIGFLFGLPFYAILSLPILFASNEEGSRDRARAQEAAVKQ